MKTRLLTYNKIVSPIHKLTGTTKFLCFIIWSVIGMLTFDTRVLGFMAITGLTLFAISKTRFSEVSFVFYFMVFFLILNNITLFVFSPLWGTEIYASRTDLVHLFGKYTITAEQLFYQLNVSLKYFSIVPMAVLFIVTTDPSEFAASLNSIGVNYKICYAVALALRYIPDIQREYHDISMAAQARGIDISKKEKFFMRIKNASYILLPLIFSSMKRIDTVSNAMLLRRFGKLKSRSWYSYRKPKFADKLCLGAFLLVFIISMLITYSDGNRFYNPF